MSSRKSARLGIVALSVVLLGAVLAGTAWAPKNLFTSSFSSDCLLPSGQEGTFQGSFILGQFRASKDGVFSSGQLTGTCSGPLPVEKPEEYPIADQLVTVTFTEVAATCDIYDFRLDGSAGFSSGVSVDMTPVEIQITGQDGIPRGRLCSIPKVARNMSPARYAAFLNSALGL